ncbi:hypothetical protein L6R49_12215 [Myxococcota bacterium]|nr:hypothetical protein [Myxococcota bacterium]
MILLLSLLACVTNDADRDDGLMGDGALWPFPNVGLIGPDGDLKIPEGALPQVPEEDGGTPWAVERLNWRDGFSTVQTAVVLLDGVRAEALPPYPGVSGGGAVRLYDLTDGVELPCYAELDAHPDALDDPDRQALLVRPSVAMTPGHRVAVVVTTAAAPRPRRFDRLARGDDPWDSGDWGPRTRALLYELSQAGLSQEEIALAWEYPVGDGTAPLRGMTAAVETPTQWSLSRVKRSDAGDTLPPGTWLQAEGSFTTTSWLEDELRWASVDDEAVPVIVGETQASLFVHIPESVRGGAPGSAPVLIFGHGLLTDPQNFLADLDDPHGFVELMDRLGVIVVATTWRGLTAKDLPDAIWVANDYGTFNELTERITQGVANNVALSRLVQSGGLMDDPLFEGLADPDQLYYYGVSAGAVLGGVAVTQMEEVDAALFHVGGAGWSTLLERSNAWAQFEGLVAAAIEDPAERQLAFAASQLLWDTVDPISYVHDLGDTPTLLQEAVNDDVLVNSASELYARTAGWTLLQPSTTTPMGLSRAEGAVRGGVISQFDPELPAPASTNRPADRTGAHETPRTWDSAMTQAEGFFTVGAPGVVRHPCGAERCTATEEASR